MSHPEYLEQCLSHKIYSFEEEREATKNMTREEKEMFWIKNNLLFAKKEASRYAKKFSDSNRIDEEDLFSVACKGLIDAAQKFDETIECKFLSYASFSVKKEICFFIEQNAYSTKLPRNGYSLLNRVNKYEESFQDEHGFKPSIKRISEDLKISVTIVKALKYLPKADHSLDSKFEDSEEDWHSFLDIDNSKNASIKTQEYEKAQIVSKAMTVLDEREKLILMAKFGQENFNLAQIGRKMKLSRERVRQIYQIALAKMKKYIEFRYEKEEII